VVDRRSFLPSFFRNYDSINGGEEKFSRECVEGGRWVGKGIWCLFIFEFRGFSQGIV